MLTILLYVVAVGTLLAIAYREAKEADRREDEIERRRQEWGHWP